MTLSHGVKARAQSGNSLRTLALQATAELTLNQVLRSMAHLAFHQQAGQPPVHSLIMAAAIPDLRGHVAQRAALRVCFASAEPRAEASTKVRVCARTVCQTCHGAVNHLFQAPCGA